MGNYSKQKKNLKKEARLSHQNQKEFLSKLHPTVELFDVNNPSLSIKEVFTTIHRTGLICFKISDEATPQQRQEALKYMKKNEDKFRFIFDGTEEVIETFSLEDDLHVKTKKYLGPLVYLRKDRKIFDFPPLEIDDNLSNFDVVVRNIIKDFLKLIDKLEKYLMFRLTDDVIFLFIYFP